MIGNTDTSPDDPKGGVDKQLSTKALQEMLRPHAVEAIEKLIEIIRLPATDKMAASQIGAARIILSKVIPDLKAIELKGKNGEDIVLPVPIYGGLSSLGVQLDPEQNKQ